MPQRADTIDLSRLALDAGSGRRIDRLEVHLDGFELAGQDYETPDTVPVVLDLSRMVGDGYAMRLRFETTLSGPCMRCLTAASPTIAVDAREVHDPRGDDPEMTSPYMAGEVLDLGAWARDALALALPNQVLCRPDCAGLCAVCGEDLNAAGPEHGHEAAPDPRWAALRELKLDQR
ncbi:YceD family protein [Capillimicrobium parvum]|uniref:DUF177 domain-containing protein n=1 Tax=Capillimicrobium parvum TaxID=2884022 RepID=A0A9E6XWL5_9ACTN|nr:DUF177 domain-containing protein [Capillimicrobium parvum]UGS35837.1 hypothetical protein DSM104329_02234 [Capillimicrobium parvum]